MKIYTGRGDEGMTDLRNMSRVSKTSARIEAYGTVDEANALIGVVRPSGHDDVDEHLRAIQNHLHIIQADFADPDDDSDVPRIGEAAVDELEAWMDGYDDELDPLSSFILPSGSEPGAKLHHARAVVRRAERRAVELAASDPVNAEAIAYLNRLSDALFVFGRVVNKREGVPEESPTY
ncbi:cob(I)yrinic acid a,c-diamide adenosyltransferase [Halomarina oriensis]|uniref:Cob(I)yrinic acid a,c-diamide adenosyltransferase n=1 Tax=Halomarina oriensis TaxID=671145 RepID=A0A6B0GQX5_9EURY|nr:cob(I)yrinic acid a,c-diamide adenosyltransferase [Halomarina oriensis]MWG35767.1 cob(I)yrinic acid a,c-diamide adenosyltransferase [Halomarina oriensis]